MSIEQQIIKAARVLAPKAIIVSLTHHTHWQRATHRSYQTWRAAVECGADGGFVRDAPTAEELLAKLNQEARP